MQRIERQKIWLEIFWWIATFLLSLLILFPILQKTNRYPFTTINIIFVVVFVSLFRYIFLLKYTWIAKRQYVKLILIFLCIPLIFNMINNLNFFITQLDEFSSEAFLGHLEANTRQNLETYIRSEMLLFGVGSIVTSMLFPFRLLMSIWRQRNKGTVWIWCVLSINDKWVRELWKKQTCLAIERQGLYSTALKVGGVKIMGYGLGDGSWANL